MVRNMPSMQGLPAGVLKKAGVVVAVVVIIILLVQISNTYPQVRGFVEGITGAIRLLSEFGLPAIFFFFVFLFLASYTGSLLKAVIKEGLSQRRKKQQKPA